MKAATVNEIKQTLNNLSAAELTTICLRLARYKKENKELITYLLYEADDLDAYIGHAKEEIDLGFGDINDSTVYFAKKGLRKILRAVNKYIRYTGSKTVEAELLLHYTARLSGMKLPLKKNTVLLNLYKGQLKKIRAAISTMHEDLQYDYLRQLAALEEAV
ncbi:MAG TPA: hypothetical protein VFR58_17505 [Flavisolibacter sp.]|nr:hypothetical protein [Flavisolibacter sp.]